MPVLGFARALEAWFSARVTGTVLNATAVLIGAGVGLTWRGQPSAVSQHAWKILLGAFTVYFGLSTTWQSLNGPWLNGLKELLVLILALMLGNLTGRSAGLQEALNRVGQYAQGRLSPSPRSASARFNDGFVACSILFCLSPISVVGALQDGLAGNWQTLAVKAVMDGLAALSFARTLGWGVLAPAVPIVAWQGTITLAARALQPWLEQHALLDPVLATQLRRCLLYDHISFGWDLGRRFPGNLKRADASAGIPEFHRQALTLPAIDLGSPVLGQLREQLDAAGHFVPGRRCAAKAMISFSEQPSSLATPRAHSLVPMSLSGMSTTATSPNNPLSMSTSSRSSGLIRCPPTFRRPSSCSSRTG